MCRPSILSFQHMSLSSLPVLHCSSLVVHCYSYYYLFQPPWRLWLRDLSNSIVTLGSPELGLGFSFLFLTAHLDILLGQHIGLIQIHSAHLGSLRPTKAHLGSFWHVLAHLGLPSLAQVTFQVWLHGLYDQYVFDFLFYVIFITFIHLLIHFLENCMRIEILVFLIA